MFDEDALNFVWRGISLSPKSPVGAGGLSRLSEPSGSSGLANGGAARQPRNCDSPGLSTAALPRARRGVEKGTEYEYGTRLEALSGLR
jgi:hypothetical protein